MRAMLASLLLLISGACLAQAFTAVDRSLPGATAAQDFLPVEQAYQLDVEILDEHSVRLLLADRPELLPIPTPFRLQSGRRQRQHRPGQSKCRRVSAATMSTSAR